MTYLRQPYPDAALVEWEGAGSLGKVACYVYDAGSMTWVAMSQPGGGGGGGGPATIANGADVAEGATTDAESAAGNGTVIALLKRLRTLLASPLDVDGSAFTQPVSGPLTDAQLRASAVPVSNANLDVALSTRLKPADALAAVTNLVQLNGQAVTMGTGVRAAGTLRVTQATDDVVQNVGELAADAVDSGNPIKIGGIGRSVLAAVSNALDRVNAMFDMYGRHVVTRKDTWAINHVPAAATKATITQAAAGAGIKNVCTSITVSLSSAAAPTVGVVQFNLRDGATGAGTILWSMKLSLPATAGISIAFGISDLSIEGTANTAMTLETAAATAANVQGTVAMAGTITQ